MSDRPKVLVFAGSLRKDSYNKKLARAAAESVSKAGGDADLLDLSDIRMPLYDGDLEASSGIPENARQFKMRLAAADAVFIAAPEYNSSITAVLKNAIDWASRPEAGEAPLAAFAGKVAALIGASPGALGGLRGLVHLRAILENIGVIVIPDQRAISSAQDAFTEEGKLKDAGVQKAVDRIARRLVEVAGKLKP